MTDMTQPVDIEALRALPALMERLRAANPSGDGPITIEDEAADAIEAMAIELEALRAERGRMVEDLEDAALAFAKARAWHHFGVAWDYLEQDSRDELLLQALDWSKAPADQTVDAAVKMVRLRRGVDETVAKALSKDRYGNENVWPHFLPDAQIAIAAIGVHNACLKEPSQ